MTTESAGLLDIEHDMSEDELNEFYDSWCDALESGNFEQGNGQLCEFTGPIDAQTATFCCLGVKAEQLRIHQTDWLTKHDFSVAKRGYAGLAIKDHVDERKWDQPPANDYPFSGNTLDLPGRMLKLIGMPLNIQTALIAANDGGRSFSEIAGEIRAWRNTGTTWLFDGDYTGGNENENGNE